MWSWPIVAAKKSLKGKDHRKLSEVFTYSEETYWMLIIFSGVLLDPLLSNIFH